MPSTRSLLLVAALPLLLAACDSMRQDLGLGRNPPDEFAVVEHPPLSMPPEYSIKPPRPGAPRPQGVDPTQQASDSLFNGNPGSTQSVAPPSDGEKALLAATGANKATPDIRATVDRETSQKVVASPHLVEQLTDWASDDGEKPSTTVDAVAEAQRIKAANDNNQPITQGSTPVIEKQTGGWLGL